MKVICSIEIQQKIEKRLEEKTFHYEERNNHIKESSKYDRDNFYEKLCIINVSPIG